MGSPLFVIPVPHYCTNLDICCSGLTKSFYGLVVVPHWPLKVLNAVQYATMQPVHQSLTLIGPELVSKVTLFEGVNCHSAFLAKAMCLSFLLGCCIWLAICLALASLLVA
jgi:hypothetical protein